MSRVFYYIFLLLKVKMKKRRCVMGALQKT